MFRLIREYYITLIQRIIHKAGSEDDDMDINVKKKVCIRGVSCHITTLYHDPKHDLNLHRHEKLKSFIEVVSKQS
jgi:hypothetical protein